MLLAQMNVGRARYDIEDPNMSGFTRNLDRVNALADAAPGFVWRLVADGNDATSLKLTDDPRFIVNMSVWEGVEPLFDFVYRTAHRDIMVRRREWFEKPFGPFQVLWWVGHDRMPAPEEGLARLAHLAAHGPTPYAFSFKAHFPPGDAGPVDLSPEPYCVGWA